MSQQNGQPHDPQLQVEADNTWQRFEEGDLLGKELVEGARSDWPEADTRLREILNERLMGESALDSTGKSVVNKESSLESTLQSESTFPMWKMLAIAAGVVGIVATMAMLLAPPQQVMVANDMADSREMDMTDDSIAGSDVGDEASGSIESEAPSASEPEPNNRFRAGNATKSEQEESRQALKSKVSPMVIPPGRSNQSGRRSQPGFRADIERFEQAQSDGQQGQSGQQQSGDGNLAFDMPTDQFHVVPETASAGEAEKRTLDGLFDDSRSAGETYEFNWYRDPLGRGYERDRTASGEQYDPIYENAFLPTRGEQAISTFSIDVDTASYANVRRFLNNGQRPPANAVRIEELVNYFNYDYPQPDDGHPFSVNMEVAACPWNSGHRLLRVGLKGVEVHRDERPVTNLVFLLDVSGSMNNPDKLPLLKRGLRMMVDRLTENDRISIVTYAGNAGLVLPPTTGDQKQVIHQAIEGLSPGGSTNGSAGIELAYDLARQNLVEEGVNRVLWATDGDLNVGITGDRQLVNLVAERASEGIFLTTLGFGTGNLKDSKLEKIADNGNGIYAYIDSLQEARKVLVEQMSGSLVTIAKDVKLQIEFNPAEVAAYRLIGYENRILQTEDFDNDARDAGEIGAGHTVTALYELVPTGAATADEARTRQLKYQGDATQEEPEAPETRLTEAATSGELLTLALRYKLPDQGVSTRIEHTIKESGSSFDEASEDFRFASAVAAFGMHLRGSKYRGKTTVEMIESIASAALGEDKSGYRVEFLDLVRRLR